MTGSAKVIAGYLAYAIGTLVLFFYLLFPGQIITSYIENRLAAIDPAIAVRAKSVRLSPLLGLKMEGVNLQRDGVRWIHVDHVRLSPELMSLTRPDKRMRFDIFLAGGAIRGQATLTPEQVRGNMTFDGIHLEQIDFIKRIDNFSLSGILRGHLTQEDDGGASTGQFSISGLKIHLNAPLLEISDIAMEKTDAEFSLQGSAFHLSALSFSGPMAEGRISGTILMDPGFSGDQLNLVGTIRPQPNLLAKLQSVLTPDVIDVRTLGTRGLPFQIRGTVDQPDVSLR